MIIEAGLIISFATWLGSKIADKGFDAVYSKLTKESNFDNTFNKCVFLNNSSSNDMDSAIVAPAGMGEPKVLMLHKCLFHNTTKLDANDRGIVFGDMDVVTPVDLSGVAKELIT